MPKSANKDLMLSKGFELLYDHGYEETGVQRITASCGVPKGSFYYYFASKEAFALEVLGRYRAFMGSQLEQHLEGGEGTPLTRLQRLFEVWTDLSEAGDFRRGCLAGTLCQEMAAKNAKFRVAVHEVFATIQGYFEACLRAAQQAGEIAASEDIDGLASFMLNGWQGALLRMKASQSRVPLDHFQAQVFGKLLVS